MWLVMRGALHCVEEIHTSYHVPISNTAAAVMVLENTNDGVNDGSTDRFRKRFDRVGSDPFRQASASRLDYRPDSFCSDFGRRLASVRERRYEVFGDTSVVAKICRYLYDSRVGAGIRESIWVFPIIEGTHLLGIALSVGLLCWFDLRLLGLALRDEPVSKVWASVMPVAFVGFALMFVSGILLFWAEAFTAFHSVHFWLKMILLVLAGVNALSFESTAHKNMAEWDLESVPPLRARMTGAISLILWMAIIVTGRTMAYNF